MHLYKDKVYKTNHCWFWIGATTGDGYGQIKIGKKNIKVHRYFWELHNNKKIPSGLVACHICDIKNCVRPDHLFIGTNQDNIRDASKKGRIYNPKRFITHCKHGHEYTEKNTMIHNKRKTRSCKECKKIKDSKRDRRRLI